MTLAEPDAVEARILRILDEQAPRIVAFARDIYDHAELGYKEHRTAARFAEVLRELGLTPTEGLAVTGVKASLGSGPGPSVALIGELDGLRIPAHAHANPATQAAHCCGHHAQLAGVVGAAIALSDPEVAASLGGRVVFFAVPAEEYGEIEFKNQLAEQGLIRFGGGKAELIRVGAFDDIDLSVVHHTHPGTQVVVGSGTNNGFVSEVIRLLGRASHAAAAPEQGVNALDAATLGLQALALQRASFRDEDAVRVHPILTRGGDLVNVVPAEAVVETLVRARTWDAVHDAAAKVDRAFIHAARALGAGWDIQTAPGYLPTLPSPADPAVLRAAELGAAGRYEVSAADPHAHSTGSTDVGDLDHLQPVVKFSTGGADGGLHTAGFTVTDEDLAYLQVARTFALSAYGLLRDGAAQARRIVDEFDPALTRAEYLATMEAMFRHSSGEPEPYRFPAAHPAAG